MSEVTEEKTVETENPEEIREGETEENPEGGEEEETEGGDDIPVPEDEVKPEEETGEASEGAEDQTAEFGEGTKDEETEEKIIELFKSLAHEQDKIVIIVTHSKRVANHADKLMKLRRGELKEVE